MCWLALQAGVASSRSLEEVVELEQALCFLIKRSADIADAKAAKLHAQIHSAVTPDPQTAEPGVAHPNLPPGNLAKADAKKCGNMLSGDRADHAEGDSSKCESEEVGVSEPSVSASSELITPEVEKLLPKATHRVSFTFECRTVWDICEPGDWTWLCPLQCHCSYSVHCKLQAAVDIGFLLGFA